MNQNQNIIQKEESNLNRPDQYMQESDTEKEEPPNLLILPYNKKYAHIVDINREIKSIKMKTLLSNPLLLKVLAVHANKIELRFNETLYLNQINDTEIKFAMIWTSDSLKLKMLKLSVKEKMTKREISKQLWVPYSTVWRIIRRFYCDPNMMKELFKQILVNLQFWKRAQRVVLEFIKKMNIHTIDRFSRN